MCVTCVSPPLPPRPHRRCSFSHPLALSLSPPARTHGGARASVRARGSRGGRRGGQAGVIRNGRIIVRIRPYTRRNRRGRVRPSTTSWTTRTSSRDGGSGGTHTRATVAAATLTHTRAHTGKRKRALAHVTLVQAAARPRTGDREWPDSRLRVRTRRRRGVASLAASITPRNNPPPYLHCIPCQVISTIFR